MRLAVIIAASAAALAVAACDSPADRAAEVQADTIENRTEATADSLERQAAETRMQNPGSPAADATADNLDQRADRVERAGDAAADRVEQQAGRADDANTTTPARP